MNHGRAGNGIIPWRLQALQLIVLALAVIFAARLFQLQIVRGEVLSQDAYNNRIEAVSIPAPRGVIYDRNGVLLVRNVPIFNVMITPALLPDSPAEMEAIYQRISDLTGVPMDQEGPPARACIPGRGILQLVEEGATNSPYDAWPIACDVDERTARILREEQVDLPGVSVETVPIRDYPTGVLTAAVIGYMGPIPESRVDYYEERGFVPDRDRVGYSGLEFEYQDVLAGRNGSGLVEVDVAGQVVRSLGDITAPVPGYSLRLTIDTRLQAAAESALRNRMEFLDRYVGEPRTSIGVVIAMNPQTGEILAMVTIPSYENNRFARLIPAYYYEQLVNDARLPLVNHAIQSVFPPGSTFKLVTAVGALTEGVITPERRLEDPGQITIANRYYPNDPGRAKDFVCWLEEGHGSISMLNAIAVSCNIYFYKIGGGFPGEVDGDGLGIERIGTYARAIGYGNPLGIDLPGENPGLIPDPDWKRITQGESWSTGDTYNATTGQGYVVATPLQVLNSVATLGNGGRVMEPHMVSDVLDGEGNVVEHFDPVVRWDLSDGVITPDTPDQLIEAWVIPLVQEGMRRVVANDATTGYQGTAYPYARIGAQGPGDAELISSAGKTGTGEFCDAVANARGLCIPGEWPTHSWYAAYAPFENPEIAVVAFVYNGGEGAVTSGPIVRQVLEAYFELHAIDAAAAQ
ncbi:MAG: penicillin-binding protein 2 [Chloroflexi bacterium RBG_13_68_17]|nr:MAG: penicillin-binding protein 2 [Chloroflexi bacterium RBG_13_68_17]